MKTFQAKPGSSDSESELASSSSSVGGGNTGQSYIGTRAGIGYEQRRRGESNPSLDRVNMVKLARVQRDDVLAIHNDAGVAESH